MSLFFFFFLAFFQFGHCNGSDFKKYFYSWLLANTIQIPLHEHERLDIFVLKWKTRQINRLVKISWKMAICYFICPVWQLGQHYEKCTPLWETDLLIKEELNTLLSLHIPYFIFCYINHCYRCRRGERGKNWKEIGVEKNRLEGPREWERRKALTIQ